MKNFGPIGLSYLSQKDLLSWLKHYTETNPTIYDNAMDSEYIKTGIGGYTHRLFDGGHDPFGAAKAVRDASDNDTIFQEIFGYASAMFKDMSTPEGVPFVTVDKEWYDKASDLVSSYVPFASKEWFRDILSMDTFEIFSTSLTVLAKVYFLNKKDVDNLSRLLGSVSILSIISANVFMGVAVMHIYVQAFSKSKTKVDKKGFTKGASVSLISSLVFKAVGYKVGFSLVFGMILMSIFNKKAFTSKFIQNQLFQIAAQTQSLCKLMAINAFKYDKINKGYSDIIINSEALIAGNEALIRDSQSKLSNREDILEQIKKMK